MAIRYLFSRGRKGAEGEAAMVERLGARAARLCDLARQGVPVPPGFTISTDLGRELSPEGGRLPDWFWDEVGERVLRLEDERGRRFGRGPVPLVLGVRPGPEGGCSWIGLSRDLVEPLGTAIGARPAWAAWIRVLRAYCLGVLRLPAEALVEAGIEPLVELTDQPLPEAAGRLEALVKERSGTAMPAEPEEQLRATLGALLRAPAAAGAVACLPVDLEAVPFESFGQDSGRGRVSTRDPADGARRLVGTFRPCGGETRELRLDLREADRERGAAAFPDPLGELAGICERVEGHFVEPMELEFAVEGGHLFVLEAQPARVHGPASGRVAMDFLDRGLLEPDEALRRADPDELPAPPGGEALEPWLDRLLGIADARSRLTVTAQADSPAEATRALGLGAKGIGLSRTAARPAGGPGSAAPGPAAEELLRLLDGREVVFLLPGPELDPDGLQTEVEAIARATLALEGIGSHPRPALLLPPVPDPEVGRALGRRITTWIQAVAPPTGPVRRIPLGAVVDTPRACLLAGELAGWAGFLAIDLDRLDASTSGHAAIPARAPSPLDRSGVGELVRMAVARGRAAQPGLQVGAWGRPAEAAGGIAYLQAAGLDSVACVPARIPAARLASGRAALLAAAAAPAAAPTRDAAPGAELRTTRILFPTDFSEDAHAALPFARILAGSGTAEIFLLHVVSPVLELGQLGGLLPPGLMAEATSMEAARIRLAREAARFGDQLRPIALEVRVGDPAETIDAYAREIGATFIVMATRQPGLWERLLHPSVAEHTVRGAPCPVFVVPSHPA